MPRGQDKSKSQRITCHTPSPGKQPVRIDKWKYDAVRRAIHAAVPRTSDGILFRHLAKAVASRLTPEERSALGSVSWYTTVVKLHLEYSGELERIEGTSPQRLRRVR